MNDDEVFRLLTQEYSIILATSDEEIEAVKKIREEVFAPKLALSSEVLEEKGFLYGESDRQSFLYLLRENVTGRYVGTSRIFFVNHLTPISKITKEIYSYVENIDLLTVDYPVCEISRFALSSQLTPYKNLSALQLRGYLSMALMATIGITLFLYRCEHIFATMERSLHRIIKRQNIEFEQIGASVEYYGTRTPYMIRREILISDAKEIFERIVLFYLKELCQDKQRLDNYIDQHPYLNRSDMQVDRVCELVAKYGDQLKVSHLVEES